MTLVVEGRRGGRIGGDLLNAGADVVSEARHVSYYKKNMFV